MKSARGTAAISAHFPCESKPCRYQAMAAASLTSLSNSRGDLRKRQNAHFAESIDRRGVVGYIVAGARGEVGRHVEGVLGAELESPFHNPALLRLGGELLHAATLVAAEDLQGGV